MNPKALTKRYDPWRARERPALLMAASVRAIAVERPRLVDSTLCENRALPHPDALARALTDAATMHRLILLEALQAVLQGRKDKGR